MKFIAFAVALAASPVLPAAAQTPPLPVAAAHRGTGMKLAEFQARQRAHVMRADTDHDGRVSLAEWTAWRAAHPGPGSGRGDPVKMFHRLDANHDGYITPDEIDAQSARRFARMDANQDGLVTPDERAAMRQGGDEPAEPLSPQ